MSLYSTVHSWLVRRTFAYQELLGGLGQRVDDVGVPAGLRIAAPSSTGEWPLAVHHEGDRWLALDVDDDCLAASEAALGPSTAAANRDLYSEPLAEPGSASLVLCVHFIHTLKGPAQDAFLGRVAEALSAGGVLVLVAFSREEGWLGSVARVARERGIAYALNFAVWRLPDALYSSSPDRRSSDRLAEMLVSAGLQVEGRDAVFAGCSTVLLARKRD